MKDHSCSWMIWSIVVILTLAIGIYAGYKVMKAISDIKVMELEAQLETANANLADGNQLERAELIGRPSIQD